MSAPIDPEWEASIHALHTPGAREPRSRALQEYIIAWREDLEFRHSLLEGYSVDWSACVHDLVEAGRDAVEAAVRAYSTHLALVAEMGNEELTLLKRLPAICAYASRGQRSITLEEVRSLAKLLPSSEVQGALAAASAAALAITDHEGQGEPAMTPPLLTVPQACTVGELIDSMKRVRRMQIGMAAANAEFDALWWRIAALCRCRVRDGQSTVLYSANGPDLPGDELYEDDCICAADAIGILRHAHMDFIPARKEVVLRQRQDFVVSVLAQVLSHLTAPHHLIVAIARQTDAKEGVRTAVYLEQAWARDARSNPRDHRGAAVGVITVGSPHMRAICQMARKFGVNVLMPDLGLMEVSDKSATAIARASVRAPPTTKLVADKSQYRLVRHSELAGKARAAGLCPAETIAFATGSENMGDRVEASMRAEAAKREDQRLHFNSLHTVNMVVQPEYVLNGLRDFPDDSSLTFGDIGRRSHGGMLLCDTETATTTGIARHVVVMDTWRRLIFLGGGEVSESWLAGLLQYDGSDLRGDALDVRLRELRVLRILAVRVLKEKVTDGETATPVTGRKPSAWQRKQFKKRARNASSGGVVATVQGTTGAPA